MPESEATGSLIVHRVVLGGDGPGGRSVLRTPNRSAAELLQETLAQAGIPSRVVEEAQDVGRLTDRALVAFIISHSFYDVQVEDGRLVKSANGFPYGEPLAVSSAGGSGTEWRLTTLGVEWLVENCTLEAGVEARMVERLRAERGREG